MKLLIRHGKEAGSTLIPVVILTSVGLIVTAVLGTIAVAAADFTARSRAKIQAEVAAEAGLIYAKREIQRCKITGSGATLASPFTSTNPKFEIRVTRSTSASPNVFDQTGCPPPGDTVFRILSTGFSMQAASLTGSDPYSVTMEEVVSIKLEGPKPAGPAAFFMGSTGGSNSFDLPFLVENYDKTISELATLVFSGAFECNRTYTNDIVVLTDGGLTVGPDCRITGYVYASNPKLSGSQKTFPAGWTKELRSLSHPDLKIPLSQKWISITASTQIWLNAGFEKLVKIQDCRDTVLSQLISNETLDTVYDGLSPNGCSSGLDGDLVLSLKSNIVILADKFTLQRLKITSADGEQKKVWIVVPADSEAQPDCKAASVDKISIKALDIDTSKIVVMLYTTGLVELGLPSVETENVLRGQIISCGYRPGNQPLRFLVDPMGVPEFDLSTGKKIVDRNTEYPYSTLVRFKRDIAQ